MTIYLDDVSLAEKDCRRMWVVVITTVSFFVQAKLHKSRSSWCDNQVLDHIQIDRTRDMYVSVIAQTLIVPTPVWRGALLRKSNV